MYSMIKCNIDRYNPSKQETRNKKQETINKKQQMSTEEKERLYKELRKLRGKRVDNLYPGLPTCERSMYINRKAQSSTPECKCGCQSPTHRCVDGILCPLNLFKTPDGKQFICGYCLNR